MCLLVPCAWAVLGMTVPLSGTVEDSGGKPIEGATVWLVDPYRRDQSTEVLVEAKTDAEGRFRLDRADDLAGRAPYWSPTLWAYKPGNRVAFVEFKRRVPGAEEPVRLVLGPSTRTPVRVLLPDGKPAPGSRVRLTQTHIPAPRMPLALLDRIATTTDAEGRAVLDGVRPEDVLSLDVTVEGLVTQGHTFNPPGTEDKTVSIRPVGRLSVRIVSDDPNSVRGWNVTAWTTPDEPGSRGLSTSWCRSTSDELGLTSLRPLAEGRITWKVEPPAGSTYLAIPPPSVINRAGELTEVKIQIRRAVKVEGSVRDEAGGAPVPGAKVSLLPLMYSGGVETPLTDADGRFSFMMLPGKLRFTLHQAPKTHFLPPGTPHWLDFEIKEGEEKYALAPFKLKPAAQVRGKVLDETGRPQAGVHVVGRWAAKEYGAKGQSVQDTTDARGEFVLGSIPPGAEVALSGSVGLIADSTTEKATAGDGTAMTIRLRKHDTLALSGRVLGPDGRPLADVPVRIQIRAPGQNSGQGAAFSFEAIEEVRTGPDGIYRTPAELPVGNQYRAEVRAPGMDPAESTWISSPAVEFPDVMLRRGHRPRVVVGRVVDTGGKPVAGAEVFQSGDGPRRTRDTTDGEGRFKVPGVPDSPAFLFVRKQGYRHLGRRVDPSDQSVDFAVARTDELPTSALKAAPSPISRAEDRAMARDLLATAWKGVVSGSGDMTGRLEIYQLMALVDPTRIVEMIENQVVSPDPAVLSNLALGRFEDGPREAIESLDAIGDPASAAGAFLSTFDHLAGAPIDLRRDLLDRALRRTREVLGNSQKITLLARVADRWLDLGDPGVATPIAREAQTLVAGLTKRDFPDPRADLAEALARIDLPAALKLLEGREEGYGLDRHRARIAGRIAATDPAAALRLLGVIHNDSEKNHARQAICIGMATRDLAGARALAEEHRDPTLAAILPAVAARKLAESDPDAARPLLLESFDRLGRLAEAGASDLPNAPVIAMARLLPLAARIDPERAPGFFWLTLASRPPLSTEPERRPIMPQSRQHYANLAELAMLIARYDRASADAIFAPVAERVPGMNDEMWGLGNEGVAIFKAAAAFDARAARAMLDALPEDPRPPADRAAGGPRPQHKTKTNARLALVRMLGLAPDLRRREPLRGMPGNDWLVDLED